MFKKRKISLSRKKGITSMNDPKTGSALVRIARKINPRATQGKTQLVKIGERYYKLRELG